MAQTTGTVKLYTGIGKASGKPFTALRLTVGKWKELHFPTQFEKSYLEEYLKDKDGIITLDETNEKLILNAGDYIYSYTVESKFEWRYIVQFFRDAEKTTTNNNQDDAKIDLDQEDPLNENPFN